MRRPRARMFAEVRGRAAGANVTLAMALALALAAGACTIPGPDVTRAPDVSRAPLGSPWVRPTAASPGSTAGSAVLVGAGDVASCDGLGDEATAELLEDIEGTVFTAGDNAYDRGSSREFTECYDPTWGRFKGRTLPVLGNHEYVTDGAAGHFGYFGAAAGDPSEGWYVADVGTWSVYALNSNCATIGGCEAGSPQHAWLTADLAANPRACVLAIWHHPRFSSGDHGSDPITTALWRALQDAGAEIVVTGHDHDYERFAAQDELGNAADDGLIEFVVGTGGRSHYAFDDALPNSVVRDNEAFGVLRFELGAGSWAFEFVPVARASFADSGSGTCH